jgi:hypothetical protein
VPEQSQPVQHNSLVRFVPARLGMHAQGMSDLSSMFIREIMRTVSEGQELESQAIIALRDKALDPAKLPTTLRYNAGATNITATGSGK